MFLVLLLALTAWSGQTVIVLQCDNLANEGTITIDFPEEFLDQAEPEELIGDGCKVTHKNKFGKAFATETVRKSIYRGDGSRVSFEIGKEEGDKIGFMRLDRKKSKGKKFYSVVVLRDNRMYDLEKDVTATCRVIKKKN